MKTFNIFFYTVAAFFLALPAMLYAQDTGVGGGNSDADTFLSSGGEFPLSLKGVSAWVVDFFNFAVVNLLITGCLLAFFWGVTRMIMTEDPAKKVEYRSFMIWGLVGLTIIYSLKGILGVLGRTFFY